ncbi:unnamed protein product [Chondrus crispus]|uniref:Uncharacterized protein n=1 Tax=Chondrus crispus TaxID=2769 RepID=R7QIH2_CHOCR|nr:unnamed protein product [Chondrus crispus]CDF37533.1 unnamed protein product [Chondrus crispus]|eukprot:XP_005717404.1 unnamed protein product [Chondrus crispus]
MRRIPFTTYPSGTEILLFPEMMSLVRGLLSSTVMSLFVPQIPGNQCQQYRFLSTTASHEIVASFPSLGLWYCPLNAFGQFSSVYAYNLYTQGTRESSVFISQNKIPQLF